jgi:hypothetical protein
VREMSIHNYACYNSIEKSALKEMEEKNMRDENYKQDLLNTLKDIESNTTKLVGLIGIIISNNDNKNKII